MWLNNCETLRLEYFMNGHLAGDYAVLSHTWGEEEVTFDEFQAVESPETKGFAKVRHTCRLAVQDGYKYAWVDTVCIDKRSSAELSEAINSMFRWYQNAAVCYAFLEDVVMEPRNLAKEGLPDWTDMILRKCRWFTRAWTLQELIAPRQVRFYDQNWHLVGDKLSLETTLHQITHIDVEVLRDAGILRSTSVAKRMSWSARRVSSREEDMSYALLGIFDVAMPLLYGEGGAKAFGRLQEEIIRSSTTGDHSILAWLPWDGMYDGLRERRQPPVMSTSIQEGIFAPLPYGFRHGHKTISWVSPNPGAFDLSYYGLRIQANLLTVAPEPPITYIVGAGLPAVAERGSIALNCRYEDEQWTQITLPVRKRRPEQEYSGPLRKEQAVASSIMYDRVHILDRRKALPSVSVTGASSWPRKEIVLAKEAFKRPAPATYVDIDSDRSSYDVAGSHPPEAWNPRMRFLQLSAAGHSSFHCAAISLTQSQLMASSRSSAEQDLIVYIGIGAAPDKPTRLNLPYVVFVPKVLYHDRMDLPKNWTPILPNENIFSWQGEQHVLRVDAKQVSAAGQVLFSLHFSRKPEMARDPNPRSMISTGSQSLHLGTTLALRSDATERAKEIPPYKEQLVKRPLGGRGVEHCSLLRR